MHWSASNTEEEEPRKIPLGTNNNHEREESVCAFFLFLCQSQSTYRDHERKKKLFSFFLAKCGIFSFFPNRPRYLGNETLLFWFIAARFFFCSFLLCFLRKEKRKRPKSEAIGPCKMASISSSTLLVYMLHKSTNVFRIESIFTKKPAWLYFVSTQFFLLSIKNPHLS